MNDSHAQYQRRFVVVEGAIGAGKTTLAKRLHQSLGGKLELQPYNENPYLEAFYAANKQQKKAEELGLLKDTAFLFQGFLDLRRIDNHLCNGKIVVADWLFEKFEIWRWTFPDEEKYRETLRLWHKELPTPDLIIYLNASVDVLLQRIHTRNRATEKSIEPDYIQILVQRHHDFFDFYPEDRVRLITVNSDKFSVCDDKQYQRLFGDITLRLDQLR